MKLVSLYKKKGQKFGFLNFNSEEDMKTFQEEFITAVTANNLQTKLILRDAEMNKIKGKQFKNAVKFLK